MRNSSLIWMLLLCLGLVATWIYHLYDKSVYSNQKTVVYVKDSVAQTQQIRDSLRKAFSKTIRELPDLSDTSTQKPDSLKAGTDSIRTAFYLLKEELKVLLRKKNLTSDSVTLARQKIVELQKTAEELRDHGINVNEEKRKISEMLEKFNEEIKKLEQKIKRIEAKK